MVYESNTAYRHSLLRIEYTMNTKYERYVILMATWTLSLTKGDNASLKINCNKIQEIFTSSSGEGQSEEKW